LLLIFVHFLLKTLLRNYFFQHLLRLLNAVVLKTKLSDVNTDIFVADEFLFQDVVKKNKHDSHHSFLLNFILIAGATTLVHTIANEQMCKLFREFNVMAQTVENFE
jgi:hypothetical protein